MIAMISQSVLAVDEGTKIELSTTKPVAEYDTKTQKVKAINGAAPEEVYQALVSDILNTSNSLKACQMQLADLKEPKPKKKK